MMGCSSQKLFLSAKDRHFVRSDDFGEYHGLYIYTLAQDDNLFFTHYPEKAETLPISQKIIGTWEEKDGLLSWRAISENQSSIVYVYTRNSQGVYVENNSKYYVPVELIPIKVKDGLPFIESMSGHTPVFLP